MARTGVTAMGTRVKRRRQQELFYAAEVAEASGHPFYKRLNETLDAAVLGARSLLSTAAERLLRRRELRARHRWARRRLLVVALFPRLRSRRGDAGSCDDLTHAAGLQGRAGGGSGHGRDRGDDGASGRKRLLRLRGEKLERPFAQQFETGAMRRLRVRGLDEVKKKRLLQAAACHLALLPRTKHGAGTPRGLAAAAKTLCAAILGLLATLGAPAQQRPDPQIRPIRPAVAYPTPSPDLMPAVPRKRRFRHGPPGRYTDAHNERDIGQANVAHFS